MSKNIEYIVDENDCHICISHSTGSHGYPQIRRNGISECMHRYIYKLHIGEIPPDMLIRHTCDNRKCINPKHLLLGTDKDNAQDKVARNRQIKGEDFKLAKVTEQQVREIINRKGEYINDLASEYGICPQHVGAILRGDSWEHLNLVPKDVNRKKRKRYILCKEQVVEILEKYNKHKIRVNVLAKVYNVSRATISDIIAERTWKHIPRE